VPGQRPDLLSRLPALALALALAGALAAGARAERLARDQVPEPLRPWVSWALRGHEAALCPALAGRDERACVWPGRLALELDAAGGRFEQALRVDEAAAFVALPGDRERWPEDVRAGERPLAVVEWEGRPQVRLEPGDHVVRGAFRWPALPRVLPVPPETGLVALRLEGRDVAAPERDEAGRVWLRGRAEGPDDAGERRVELEVHRKLTDEVPLRLETHLVLRVAGAPREERLGPALPPGFAPLRLASPLPARLEPGGALRVQLRPGRFEIALDARAEGRPDVLAPPDPAARVGPWAEGEVWVFEARPALRLVTPEGDGIDPQQTTLPPAWRALPAFRMEPGATLRLVERRRGDADAAPEPISLVRTFHLDFDGRGATVSDRLEGTLRARARLEMGEGTALGRAAVDGTDQFLTRREGSERAGVQVPPGPVVVEADSRVEGSVGTLPAVSWARDVASLSATLELPPGWRLLHASGLDRAEWTWLNRWTLLDLFFALVAVVAFLRLHGPLVAALAAAALALTWTEPGAPRVAWLAVLAAEALQRAVPAGRFARAIRLVRAGALAWLVALAVPFAVAALRAGLYPALVPPRAGPIHPAPQTALEDAALAREAASERARALGYAEKDEGLAAPRSDAPAAAPAEAPKRPVARPDPSARVTTGPGIPTWTWERVALSWSGPVESGRTLRLWLLPPSASALLALVQALLVGALAFVSFRGLWGRREPPAPASGAAPAAAALAAALLLAPAARAEFPPPEVLEELRARLVDAPACHPACVAIPRMRLEARGDSLSLALAVEAAAESALPLPGHAAGWLPAEVRLDGAPARALRRGADGTLWLRLPAGVHEVALSGRLPAEGGVALPLPLVPHRGEAVLEGFELFGLRADGGVEPTLQLVRLRREGEAPAPEPPAAAGIPPFLRVERALELGLTWSARVEVRRLSPLDDALVVEVPLLAGESVTSAGADVRDGRVRVALAPGVERAGWTSVLPVTGDLELAAPADVPWTESWRFAVSPIWHVTAEGIPPVQVDPSRGGPDLAFRPWPGERVHLSIERPAGIGGATATLDASHLALRPGLHGSDATLELTLRSSQGGEQRLVLPEGAELQQVAVDGTPLPVRQEGRAVVLPLAPGTQHASLAWREPRGITLRWRAPEVDVGVAGVNAEVEVAPPAGRWLLFVSGPPLGPAVLFWPLLAVYLGIAALLGRTRLAPLGTASWMLLAVGLTQVGVAGAALVPLWLLALGWRARYGPRVPGRWLDLVQVALALLTAAALVALLASIRAGLLGQPSMQIAGHGSSAELLRWYQDRTAGTLPRPSVLSVPLWVYRVLMLLWALWIAQALVGWLRFGWSAFSAGELWRPLRRPRPDLERPMGGTP